MGARSAKGSPTAVHRYAYVPRPDGPHVRLGIVWFVGVCVAAAFGTVAVVAVFASVAAIAAMQTTAVWRPDAPRVARLLTALAAVAGPVGAVFGQVGLGVGMVVAIGSAFVIPILAIGSTSVGVVLRSAVLPALAAGAAVLTARTDMGAFVVLLLLISAYECGDYLMGAEADSVFEGPLSGIVAVLVVTFAESVLRIGPFDFRAAWVFGGLVAALAPLGAPLASALAPSAGEAGPALRRLDAWFVVAPLWCWMLVNHLELIR